VEHSRRIDQLGCRLERPKQATPISFKEIGLAACLIAWFCLMAKHASSSPAWLTADY